MKSKLLSAYSRLLADLAQQTKEPLLEAHWDVSEEWVLKEAPKLDKAILRLTEKLSDTIEVRHSLSLPVNADSLYDFFFGECNIDPNPAYMRSWLTTLILLLWEEKDDDDWDEGETSRHDTERHHDLVKMIGIAHQSLVFCYKAEYEPSNEQCEEAYRSFIETDTSIGTFDEYFLARQGMPLYRTARNHISRVIYKAKWNEIAPKHGPGAVYPSTQPCLKSCFNTYYPSIDDVYPYTDWMWAMPEYWHDSTTCWLGNMVESADIVCRIQAVPKDSRGPRLICVHPKEALWIQQGTRHVLENAITHSPLTHGKINFHDQSVNGQLALESSQSKEYVTLDLREASDRLSAELVRYLFGDYAYRFLSCSRANKVRIGDRVVELKKYAPMGNALCFPVQSLCFWAMVRAGISLHYGEICDDVYVFGDDIIYPSKYHRGVHLALIRFGLAINADKTYVHGSFRESCGVDAFGGVDITPLRLKGIECRSVTDAMGFVDLARRAYQRGYHRLSAYLYNEVEQRYGKLSLTNNPRCAGLARYEDLTWDRLYLYEKNLRFNRKLHRWEIPTKLVIQCSETPKKHEWFHVQDSLMSMWRLYDVNRHISLLASECDSNITPMDQLTYSERGLVYPIPHRERLVCGWTEVLMN